MCGVPVEERGARLSEAIPLLKRLWSDEPVQHAGRFWSFPSVRMLPAPAQPGGPLFPQILPHPILQEGARRAQGPEPPDPSCMNSVLHGVREYMGGRSRRARA